MPIVSCGHQDELRFELTNNGEEQIPKKIAVKMIAGAGRNGEVGGESLARTRTGF